MKMTYDITATYADIVKRVASGEEVHPAEVEKALMIVTHGYGELARERGRLNAQRIDLHRFVTKKVIDQMKGNDPETGKAWTSTKAEAKVKAESAEQKAVDELDAGISILEGEIESAIQAVNTLKAVLNGQRTQLRDS